MPLELTVSKLGLGQHKNQPLGSRTDVRALIDRNLPGVEWSTSCTPTCDLERLAADGLDPVVLEQMRAQIAKPSLRGFYEGPGFSLEFYGFESTPLASFYIDVRGSGNPMAALATLCQPPGWSIKGPAGDLIDLNLLDEDLLHAFQAWRLRAIASIRRTL